MDHASGDVIWAGEGKDTAALDAFFAELGPQRSSRLEAVSLDMGKAYPKSVAKHGHAPQATICWDAFWPPAHVSILALPTIGTPFGGSVIAVVPPGGARWQVL